MSQHIKSLLWISVINHTEISSNYHNTNFCNLTSFERETEGTKKMVSFAGLLSSKLAQIQMKNQGCTAAMTILFFASLTSEDACFIPGA